MERDLIEQATKLNTKKSMSYGNNELKHRISERAESCQTPAIIDQQETISDHIYRETREFEGFGAWMIHACRWQIWTSMTRD